MRLSDEELRKSGASDEDIADRRALEVAGIAIDDDGIACDACGWGIRHQDVCVVDPDGEGPYHAECAAAIGHDPNNIRVAPEEFVILDREDFEQGGAEVKPIKPN